ncbi:hypothetical protein PIB30_104425 [Stylosanthes scabra]|uniref:Uncharacterized protein n=1 Tax=Stylosanthes scabra TaxID=79078 RepID=A0ABU6RYS9_9FABA|nr:hypothetical protein [Stylosanthes scabra]
MAEMSIPLCYALCRRRASMLHTTVKLDASPSSFHFILLRHSSLELRPALAPRRSASYHLLNSVVMAKFGVVCGRDLALGSSCHGANKPIHYNFADDVSICLKTLDKC